MRAKNESIFVLESAANDEKPSAIVGSNVQFVNLLLEQHLRIDEIPIDAVRSYYVDYYMAQVENGGFSQFVYNSKWNPQIIERITEGLRIIGAARHLEVFREGGRIIEKLGASGLEEYLSGEYFDENPERDALNQLEERFAEAAEHEDLLSLNAGWLRDHHSLALLPNEEALRQEAIRRGRELPDLESRIAKARANAPRYEKLIRALCEHAGQELRRITAGDPTRMHRGNRVLAWHFITDKGHHHMLDYEERATMFRGHSTTDVICEIDAPSSIS